MSETSVAAEAELYLRAVVEAVLAYDPELPLLGLPGSAVLAAAEKAGLRTVREAFADRAYTPEATLVSRREVGAVLDDPDEVALRVVRLVTEGVITAFDGSTVKVEADSVCVHGDSPGAVAMAEKVRAALADAGVEVTAFVEET